MSSNPSTDSPEGVDAPVINEAWYLHSKGRRFGPLAEDEMRGYFLAGMVNAGDTISVPGQSETVTAETVAALLGMAAPVMKFGVPLANRSAIVTPPPAHRPSWLIRIGGVVALVGAVYFTVHEPLQRHQSAATLERVAEAPTEPARVEVQMPGVDDGEQQASVPTPTQASVAPQEIDASETIKAATLSSSAEVGDRVRTAAADEWYERATILALAEDWNGMLAHASAWTVSQPARGLAWWYLGYANAQLGSLAEAETAFKQSLVVSPNDVSARWSLANVYLQLKRYPDARILLEQLVRERSAEPGLWNDLGVAMDATGEFDQAVDAYQRSLQIKPNYRLAWVNLAKCYQHFGYLDRAKAAAAKANTL